jgi:hypothetical protein
MTPDLLRRVAGILRAEYPIPTSDMSPAVYVGHSAINALAGAIEQIAEESAS